MAFDTTPFISPRARSGHLMSGRMISTLLLTGAIVSIWAAAYFFTFLGLYVVIPDLNVWADAAVEALFAIPFAFVTAYAFAIYVAATSPEGLAADQESLPQP